MKKANTFKRFTGLTAAALMAACMVAPMATSLPVSATNVSIDTSADKVAHVYTAYPIFTGTYTTGVGLTVEGWGIGFNSAGLLADTAFTGFVIDTNEEDGSDITIADKIGDSTDAAVVVQALEGISDSSEEADALAAILAKYVGGTGTVLSDTAVDLPQGYYLVKDSYADEITDPDNTKPDAISKFILRVSGNTPIEIETKKSYPTVVKKVKENSEVSSYNETDKNYNDVADYNIGDSVPFKLYGTLPSTLADYTSYKYVFTDTLGTQFTAPEVSGITVKIDGSTAQNAEINVLNNVITVSFANILNGNTVTKDSIVTVEYEAVLNGTAAIGRPGQENKVNLEYSNNPNFDGEGDTDKTPDDKVIVFTYEIDSIKVDAATGAPLKDAEFKLANAATEGQYANLIDNEDGTWTFNGWADEEEDGTTMKTPESGIFNIKGLDKGSYWLEETNAPESYNALTDRIEVVISATTANGQSWDGDPAHALTAFTGKYNGDDDTTADADNGTVSGKIENKKGSELPSTGGIGTTIFYVGGGAMVAVAGIFLITKKRMNKKED